MANHRALYFGCWDRAGHFLRDEDGRTISDSTRPADLPWGDHLMDATLLQNGKRADVVDGRVFWTCGGKSIDEMWYAFYWWDRSADSRSNSNSGFYVYGFKRGETQAAFEHACKVFPHVVERQKFPLVLQL